MWIVPLDGTFNGRYLKCLQLNPIVSTPIVPKFDNYGRDIYTGAQILPLHESWVSVWTFGYLV